MVRLGDTAACQNQLKEANSLDKLSNFLPESIAWMENTWIIERKYENKWWKWQKKREKYHAVRKVVGAQVKKERKEQGMLKAYLNNMKTKDATCNVDSRVPIITSHSGKSDT